MSYGGHSFITQTGFRELKNSLKELQNEQVEVGKELMEAKEPGKIEENVSLEIARLRKANVEARIAHIKQTLRSVVLINKTTERTKVNLGSMVTLKSGRKTRTFTVVGSLEADPSNGMISDVSPIGQDLLGKKVGDKVLIGNGKKIKYKVVGIN